MKKIFKVAFVLVFAGAAVYFGFKKRKVIVAFLANDKVQKLLRRTSKEIE